MALKIDLSNLELKEIEILTEKPKVLIIDCNRITKIDKLLSQTQLQQLSVANNQIIQINGLTSLVNLTVLNLSFNKIIAIDGIKTLSSLTWLSLSNNRIKTIEHLEGNLQLKHLDLSDNLITKLSNISHLSKLKTFLLHGNQIKSIAKIDIFLSKSVEILSLAENDISDLTEACFLYSLFNLKQLSIKENPCLMKSVKDMNFDYRPYIVNWCVDLKILDGEEISEKEKLVAEWLYTQGKGRHFKPGEHFDLVYYLTKDCAFTNLKNKSKLKNDLDNILEQRKRLSSRKSHLFKTSNAESTDEKSEMSNIKTVSTSNNLDETDLNLSESGNIEDGCQTNTSMLISDSLFLPLTQNKLSPKPKTSVSPVLMKKSNSIDSSEVPTLKFSKEYPKLVSKNGTKSILNSSINGCDLDNHVIKINNKNDNNSFENNNIKKDLSNFLAYETNNSKPHGSSFISEQTNNNNNVPHYQLELSSKIGYIIKLQAWWRSVYTRMKNPTVKRYLNSRESTRTKSHILFLQKQMQLYYESYEQQRKLNVTQNQAIQFLLDQVKELALWKEIVEKKDNQSSVLLLEHEKDKSVTSEEKSSQCTFETNSNERNELLNKIENLEEQVSTLKESIWKMEHTIHKFEETSKICQSSQNISESLCSEDDLNRVIYEVEKIYKNGLPEKSGTDTMSEHDDSPLNETELVTMKNIDDIPQSISETSNENSR